MSKSFIIGITSGISSGLILALLVNTLYTSENPVVAEEEDAFEIARTFPEDLILARAAIVYDVTEGKVVYERNADAPLPLASLTKIMTALVSHEELKEHQIARVSDKVISVESPSPLVLGERWDSDDLARISLLASSNHAARMLALLTEEQMQKATNEQKVVNPTPNHISFVERMNTRAEELGLQSLFFANETGLDISSREAGAMGSARDMAHLFAFALKAAPEVFESTVEPAHTFSSDTRSALFLNTNTVAEQIPFLVASKTGFTDLAGGNLFIAFDSAPGHRFVVGVLGSTPEDRFADILVLAKATLGQEVKTRVY